MLFSGAKCANCGKGILYGHNVSHAKNRTKRLFKPNLHSGRVMFEGKLQRVRLCVKCLRMLKKKQVKATTNVPVQPTIQATA